jgi:membrane-associated phospholipid phosphatase
MYVEKRGRVNDSSYAHSRPLQSGMRSKISGYTPLLWILTIPVLNIFYSLLNHGGTHVSSLITDLDKQIPFVSAFILPYLIWYPFVLTMLIALFVKQKLAYYRTLSTLGVGLIACYITFHFFQTTIQRPQITEDGLFYWLVKMVYKTDGAYNCFPSIHVLSSYLMLKGMSYCGNFSKTSRLLIFTTSWSIIISTVFVKQHVLLDIVGAILLAEMLFFLVGKMLPSQAGRRQSVAFANEED